MSSEDLWKWLLGPTGLLAGLAAWLFRRRLSGSWIGRRLAAENALAQCQERERDLMASFDRQEATLLREIAGRDREVASRDREIAARDQVVATRDREIGYMMAALERLNRSAAEVLEVHDPASLRTSDPSPTGHSPSPAPSPTSPAKPPASTAP